MNVATHRSTKQHRCDVPQRTLRAVLLLVPPLIALVCTVACDRAERSSAKASDELTRAKAGEIILAEVRTGSANVFNKDWVNPGNTVEVSGLQKRSGTDIQAIATVTTPPGVPDANYPRGGITRDCAFTFQRWDDGWRLGHFGGVDGREGCALYVIR